MDASFDRVMPRPDSGSAYRLSVDLTAAWQDIDECAHGISRIADTVRDTPADFRNLDDTRAWYEQTSRQLLIDPVGEFARRQPVQRALDAMRTCTGSSSKRRRLDLQFERLLTRAALDLCEPWRIWRGGNLGVEWQRWRERWDWHARASSALLLQYAQLEQQPRQTAAPAAASIPPPQDAGRDTRSRQQALIATIDVELALRDLTLKWFDAARAYAADLRLEQDALRSYADATVSWLEDGAPPRPDAADTFELMAPEERLRSWSLAVETEASRRLPEGIELLAPGTIVHSATRCRSVAVRKLFLSIFDTYARPEMRAIVDQYWNAHAARLREVEQTKEMIAYWREAPTGGSAGTPDLLAEGRHNAIAALTGQRQVPPDAEALEARIADSFAAWRRKGFIAFEGEEDGWVALLERPRGRQLLDTAWDAGRARAHTALHRVARWTSARVEGAMESVAGRVPSRPVLPAVVRRTTLHDTLSLETAKSELPALYRSLFRLTPVEDRRFLLGREDELAGLQQALDDWRRGRFAACLVVGARGSGKTSLLNCAVEAIFAGECLIRAECNERITSPARLDAFLRTLLHVDDRVDLEAAFDAGRRILIIEEAERIYLRRAGGFAAADYLTHLIQRTAATTLWIVVMNDRSFLVLDAGTHLHRVFSHRINAMNVSRADLERAILARHRLTGLRLEFAPPPPEDPRVSRAKRWLGLEESAQKLFFDSLFQQSEGIFRSAFQLWLSSIERVDGETLRIRQPLDPAFTRFRSELAREDHFTLSVIQQHGSLTQDELAGVLCEAPERSRSRMERLSALGLVERDPEHPGLRLNPEAQRFVNDLLRRANLA